MSEKSLDEILPNCPACKMTDTDQALAELIEQAESEKNKSI